MRRTTLWALFVLIMLLVLATAVTVLDANVWFIRIADFPRLQILALLLLLGGIYLWMTREKKDPEWIARPDVRVTVGVLVIAAAGFQLGTIIPFTPVAGVQSEPAPNDAAGETLSILVSNVLMTNRKPAPLRAEIEERDPDVVLLLEPDAWWAEQMAFLEATHPYTAKAPLDNTYGLLFYSRLPAEDLQIRYLVEDTIPSVKGRLRLPDGTAVAFFGIHPKPPVPGQDDDSTERDAELMIVAKEAKDIEGPVVVAGDFNDVSWSNTTELFQEVSSLLDPRRGRGFMSTFPAARPLLRFPLDHVFHSDHFYLHAFERLPEVGDADHLPIYAALRHHPVAESDQDTPQASPDEQDNANQKIDKATQAN